MPRSGYGTFRHSSTLPVGHMNKDDQLPPDAAQLSSSFIEPGRKWLLLTGDFAGQVGTEVCATRDFAWVGLAFHDKPQVHTFSIRNLQPAH
jgi:hypothetical protein